MCAHIKGRDPGAVDAGYDSQICFDYHAINGMLGLSRELMALQITRRKIDLFLRTTYHLSKVTVFVSSEDWFGFECGIECEQ